MQQRQGQEQVLQATLPPLLDSWLKWKKKKRSDDAVQVLNVRKWKVASYQQSLLSKCNSVLITSYASKL